MISKKYCTIPQKLTVYIAWSITAQILACSQSGELYHSKTDMGGSSAPREPEQGADTAIWLTTTALASIMRYTRLKYKYF